jgi:hypothetical protein
MRLRALVDLSYGNDDYRAGDVFTAEERDAQSMILQGLAEPADVDD